MDGGKDLHQFWCWVNTQKFRVCGPAILVHAASILTNRTELQSPVVKLEFMYVYLGTAVLVSVNTKIETYKLKNILIFTDTLTGQ
jgi:hypothetical protein